jgi:hypothetical protein
MSTAQAKRAAWQAAHTRLDRALSTPPHPPTHTHARARTHTAREPRARTSQAYRFGSASLSTRSTTRGQSLVAYGCIALDTAGSRYWLVMNSSSPAKHASSVTRRSSQRLRMRGLRGKLTWCRRGVCVCGGGGGHGVPNGGRGGNRQAASQMTQTAWCLGPPWLSSLAGAARDTPPCRTNTPATHPHTRIHADPHQQTLKRAPGT